MSAVSPHPPAYYSAFGLVWQMPLPFSELRPAPAGSVADVVVREAAACALSSGRGVTPIDQAGGADICFELPGEAYLRVRNGNELVVVRHDATDDQMVRLLLMGAGAALILHQRGLLPLHASAIATPGGAVLFMGHSGSGKSTLLNVFLRRGYPMLAEDLSAVRLDGGGNAWVEPGVRVTKLWADSAAALGQTTAGLPRVRPALDKFVVPVGAGLAMQPVRLRAIYVLAAHEKTDVVLAESRDADKFNALLDHTWQKLVVRAMGLHADHFRRAVMVANQVRILRVRRPQTGFRLAELADAVEADFCAAYSGA